VQRLDGCLPALAPRVRRVIVLRAGVGSAPAHSRIGVARRLDLPVKRVGRLERRGLRILRRAGRASGCEGAAAPASVAAGTAAATGAGMRFVSSDGSADTSGGGGSRGGGDSGGDSPTTGALAEGTGEVLGESSEQPPAAAAIRQGGGDVTPLLLALILGIAVTAGALAVRREMR
jgi:hypothetical protein